VNAQVSAMFTSRSFGKVGVEAYAAYALRAWLGRSISARTRRFAKWSAIWSKVILSFRVSQACDLRCPVVDSVADGTLAA
jgi:hypothetical protein